MRILFLILVLVNGTILAASPGGAAYTEEITASWESGYDSDIMGGRILDDLRNNREAVLKVNAFCSYESIRKISELRSLAVTVINGTGINGIFAGDIHIAGAVLKSIGELSYKPLSASEQKLVLQSEIITASSGVLHGNDFTAGTIPDPEFSYGRLNISLTSASSFNIKNGKDKDINRRYILNEKNSNHGRDFFEIDHADLYRLFLYVKDNSGNRKKRETVNRLTSLCSLHKLYNSIRFKNTLNAGTSITAVSIHQSGVFS